MDDCDVDVCHFNSFGCLFIIEMERFFGAFSKKFYVSLPNIQSFIRSFTYTCTCTHVRFIEAKFPLNTLFPLTQFRSAHLFIDISMNIIIFLVIFKAFCVCISYRLWVKKRKHSFCRETKTSRLFFLCCCHFHTKNH